MLHSSACHLSTTLLVIVVVVAVPLVAAAVNARCHFSVDLTPIMMLLALALTSWHADPSITVVVASQLCHL